MDKLDTAVKIYKYGLENVSVADESYKVDATRQYSI
jgi:hypothetical protein